ncbi:MAG TPA: CDP-diacylglycerol--serine O-phosphatidyltransferase [Flavitalea sp.]|nr:CDP-diacylglycerol--serine O-phosphatidyltransferase [Flavitalea sp.]
MKQIPNLFTLLNLVFGFMAIICILQTGEMFVTQNDDSWLPQLPERIWLGSLFIGLAAIVDFLDGFIARLFKASSEMGRQLDSLADLVSFGVAPGLILYQLLRLSYMQESDGIDTALVLLLPAVLFPCAGAWRLARFNITDSKANGFTGVPIPAAGLVVASLPLILFYDQFNASVLLLNKWFLYLVIVLLSLLMVSRWRFMSMKFTSKTIRGNLPKIILAAAAVISALLLQWLAVPLVFVLYILISITTKKTLQ